MSPRAEFVTTLGVTNEVEGSSEDWQAILDAPSLRGGSTDQREVDPTKQSFSRERRLLGGLASPCWGTYPLMNSLRLLAGMVTITP